MGIILHLLTYQLVEIIPSSETNLVQKWEKGYNIYDLYVSKNLSFLKMSISFERAQVHASEQGKDRERERMLSTESNVGLSTLYLMTNYEIMT